jgi:nitrous oxidase accessory protein NosD
MRFSLAVVLAVAVLALAATPASAQPACGDVLTQDTTLTGDLDCPGVALTVGAPGITIDLGGHRIHTFSIAVRNEGHDDVTIRNGVLSGQSGGVLVNDADRNTIRDVAVDATTVGVWLKRSDDNRILASTFTSAYLALDEGSDRNVVRGNLFTQFEGVLWVQGSSDNRIVENVIWTSRDTPIGLSLAHRNVIRRNTFVNQLGDLMHLYDSDDNRVVENSFAQYGESARGVAVVLLAGASGNRFNRNGFGGVPSGVWVQSGAGNAFRDNDLSGAVVDSFDGPADGFFVDAAATGTVVRENTAAGFEDDGIDVEAPGTFLLGNRADDNADLGIEAAPGIVDLGGNRASGNGNQQQCLNVVCR